MRILKAKWESENLRFFFSPPVTCYGALILLQLWGQSSIFTRSQKIKSPDVAVHLFSNVGRNTHRVKVEPRVLKAVTIVMSREGEVVIYCLLEKSEGRDKKAHIGTTAGFQNLPTAAWKEDRAGRLTAKWELNASTVMEQIANTGGVRCVHQLKALKLHFIASFLKIITRFL